jgi:hypothetical protein
MADTFTATTSDDDITQPQVFSYSYDGVSTITPVNTLDLGFNMSRIKSAAGGGFFSVMADTAVGGQYKLYKLKADLTVDTTFNSPNGFVTLDFTLLSGVNIAVDLSNNVAIAHPPDSGGDTITMWNSAGTEVFSVDPEGSGTKTGLLCDFMSNGNLLVVQNITTGADFMYQLSPTDGSTVATYDSDNPSYDPGSLGYLHFGSDGFIYSMNNHSGIGSWFAKWDPTAVSPGGTAEWSTSRTFNERNVTSHIYISSEDAVYTYGIGGAQISFLKHDVSTSPTLGNALATYSHGQSTTNVNVAELNSGNLVWALGASRTGADGTFNIIITDLDLNFKAGYNETRQTGFFGVAGKGPQITTTTTPTDLLYTRNLVAITGNKVFYESATGTMTEIDEGGGGIGQGAGEALDTSKSLTAAEAYQKVFIANATTARVVDFTNDRVSCGTAITASDTPQHGDILHQGASNSVVIVTDTVLSTRKTLLGKVVTGTVDTGNNILDANNTVIMNTANTISVFNSVPFYYDHTPQITNGTSGGAFKGAMPEAPTLVCRYRGRIVYAGDVDYPYQWYMARQANPFDWQYLVNDAQAPVAGGNADAGEIGDVIQSLIPKGDDYLVFGCSNSMWLMRGDPAAGGSLDELTLTTGCYGPRSFCFDEAGNMYFWGRNGIYVMPPNFGGLNNISSQSLPNLVQDEAPNKSTHRIVMSYDRKRMQVYIFITKMSNGANSNYIYDIRTQGFFPESYPATTAPFSSYFYDATDPDYQHVYLGGRDGTLRRFDSTKKDDATIDGDQAINSYATIGPLQIGQDADSNGRLKTLSFTTSTDTDGISYDIHVADSAEEVVDDAVSGATPLHTGTLSAGNRVQTTRPRARGAWMGVKLKNATASESWEFEKIVADVKPAGDIK